MEQKGEKPLKAVIHRCPFCHEGAEPEGSVACQGCLARHHEACWSEAGRCGSCGSQQALAPMARPTLTVELVTATLRERGYSASDVDGFFATLKASPSPRRRGRAGLIVATLVAIAAVVNLGVVMSRRQAAERRREGVDDLVRLERDLHAERDEALALVKVLEAADAPPQRLSAAIESSEAAEAKWLEAKRSLERVRADSR